MNPAESLGREHVRDENLKRDSMDSQIRVPSPPHNLPFWRLAFQDGLTAFVLILLAVMILLQVFAIGGIFWSRSRFGSRFDPVVYSDFATRKSDASVEAAFGLKEAEIARRAAAAGVRDDATLAMEKATQELKQVQARQDESEIVKKQSEQQAELWTRQADAFLKNGADELALRQLQSALQIAPDYLPALMKAASLYEKRQDLAQARFQWEKAVVVARPESQEMNEIQQNLKRLTKLYTEAEQSQKFKELPAILRFDPPVIQKTNPLQLVLVTRKELPLEDLYDLRFKLDIVLGFRGTETFVDIQQTKVEVAFYDQSYTAEGTLIPIKILNYPLQPKETWATGSERTLFLEYKVPRGYFRGRIQSYGSSYNFCGFVVHVYYRGQLQDVYAAPSDILKKYVRTS